MQHIVEHMSILGQKSAMRQTGVVPRKHGVADLTLAQKDMETKAEEIPVYMNQGQTETQKLKDKDKIPTVMVHAVHTNETTTLCIYTEEEWRQATPEDHDLGYNKNILSVTQETKIHTKELSNKGYVKPFEKGRMELYNVLISY